MISDSDLVINYLLKHRNVDFSGYRHPLIESQLDQRVDITDTGTVAEYYEYLQSHEEEIDTLIDTLMINVSGFFRDPLAFSYLASKIIPELISGKIRSGNLPLRIWSAGCATGEEPYSIAIEINEILKQMTNAPKVNIFATDIDDEALEKANRASYTPESLKNTRFEYLKYFDQKGERFSLKKQIKSLVNFSKYDLLDKNSYCPPESLFGDFDLVLCRNVLIYYNTRCQNNVFTKLYRSLNDNAYLVLGETETPTRRFHDYFRRVNECCHIYAKIK